MGRLACDAVRAADDLVYAGGFARTALPEQRIEDDVQTFLRKAHPDVVLDVTTYPKTIEVASATLEHGAALVVGASGWTSADREALSKLAMRPGGRAMLVPNFALGAVLMMRFAQDAARFFPAVEIVELHHDRKRDKPSGTAVLTAERIRANAAVQDIPIHSVRLPGLLAHQEIIFGGTGETLTIRHDSLSRDSFVAGMLMAIRGVRALPGLNVGLDVLLESSP